MTLAPACQRQGESDPPEDRQRVWRTPVGQWWLRCVVSPPCSLCHARSGTHRRSEIREELVAHGGAGLLAPAQASPRDPALSFDHGSQAAPLESGCQGSAALGWGGRKL